MKLKTFVIHDSKVEAYMNPFLMRSKGEAIRAITDEVNGENTQLSKHPEDFTLFEIGEYDQIEGRYTMHDSKISLGNCIEMVKGENNE